MKSYQRFLTSTAFIVFVLAVLVTVGITFIVKVNENPTHIEFAKECALLDGRVQRLNGVTFCVTIRSIPNVVFYGGMTHKEKYKTTHECHLAGGQMFDLSRKSFDYGCYKFTIFEELGARNDYVLHN